MTELAIMQGRLVPPENHRLQSFPAQRWRDEFPRAAEVGVSWIEWIYETFGAEANPIATEAGIAEVRALGERWGVGVASLCADVLMERPVLGPAGDPAAATGMVRWLIARACAAGIRRLVLPFVGANAARTESDVRAIVPLVAVWGAEAGAAGLELHLETALPPQLQAELLTALPAPSVRVTWDIGNSLQFGFDHMAEMAAYGDRIGSVHVKDAMRRGTTVPLGTGQVDFVACFRALRCRGYGGPYVLQAARVPDEDPLTTVRCNVGLVRGWLAAATGG